MKLGWNWEINKNNDIDGTKYPISKFMDFFVIHCPVKGTSKRQISFKERNIDQNSLISKIKKEIPSLAKNWETSTKNKLSSLLSEKGISYCVNNSDSFAYHCEEVENETDPKDKAKSKTTGFFYSIRCGFSHGSIKIEELDGEKYYLIANDYRNKPRGRFLLKETELLKIVNIVENWGSNE